MAKYLRRLGWEVTVVTPHPSVWRRIDNPEETASKINTEGIRRILTSHSWRFLRPQSLNYRNSGVRWFAAGVARKIARQLRINRDIGWIKGVNQACSALSPGVADIILATGSPFASFKLAKELSTRLGCPYVLDYRDPWTENPHRPTVARASVVREEECLLAGSAAVTIVSPSWGRALDRRFGVGSKLHVLSNGYDPEELADIAPHDFGHFAIVYAGNFYPPKRVISPIMAALERLLKTTNGNNREWFFHYYGRHERHVFEEAKHFGISEKVVSHGWVPPSEALAAVRGAGLTVVISSVEGSTADEDKGIMTGKVYEALGLNAPVLVVAPQGSDLETLSKGRSTVKCLTGGSIHEMSDFISGLMCGSVPKAAPDGAFAWPAIAEKLDLILREAIGSRFRVELERSRLVS